MCISWKDMCPWGDAPVRRGKGDKSDMTYMWELKPRLYLYPHLFISGLIHRSAPPGTVHVDLDPTGSTDLRPLGTVQVDRAHLHQVWLRAPRVGYE